jgi:hypothetical protein
MCGTSGGAHPGGSDADQPKAIACGGGHAALGSRLQGVSTFDLNATPAQRFAMVLELHEFAVEQMRANLRRRMPGASPEQIEEELGEWSMHRPGAEHGDGVGRPVDPSVRFR